MINLGKQEFYIKLMINGESYDPFSAVTLKVLPPNHDSYKDRIIDESRKQYSISADAAKKLIEAEEATILRSAQEKAIITGSAGSRQAGGKKAEGGSTGGSQAAEELKNPEPLI